MSWATWLAVVSICALGAMSPGPSLAVVLKHTLTGREPGFVAAVTHALGIGLYAFACIAGLAFLITQSNWLYSALQWAGAAYLLWMGIRGLMSPRTEAENEATPTAQLTTENLSLRTAATDGFLIAFLNPKVAVFFIALFSQVIGPDTSVTAKMLYAGTALFIDMAWYLLVVWMVTRPSWLAAVQKRSWLMERLFGVILIALAARLVVGSLGSGL